MTGASRRPSHAQRGAYTHHLLQAGVMPGHRGGFLLALWLIGLVGVESDRYKTLYFRVRVLPLCTGKWNDALGLVGVVMGWLVVGRPGGTAWRHMSGRAKSCFRMAKRPVRRHVQQHVQYPGRRAPARRCHELSRERRGSHGPAGAPPLFALHWLESVHTPVF